MSSLALTVLTAAVLCVLWYAWINRPRFRPCARCGRRVKIGELEVLPLRLQIPRHRHLNAIN